MECSLVLAGYDMLTLSAHKHRRRVCSKYMSSFFEVSAIHCERDGAVNSFRAAAFFKCKQEVHHLPYLGQLSDPLSKLMCVSLVALNCGVAGRPPESPDGLQQLTRHQIGEVRRPELRGGRDGEASHLG